jgi:hypothetical protein
MAAITTARRTKVIYSNLLIFVDVSETKAKHPLVQRLQSFKRTIMSAHTNFSAFNNGERLGGDPLDVSLKLKLPHDIPLSWTSSGGDFDDLGGEHIEGWAIDLRFSEGKLNFEAAGLDFLEKLIPDLPILRVTRHFLVEDGNGADAIDKSRDPQRLALEWIRLRGEDIGASA